MSGQPRCPECGSSKVEEDSHYSQNHLVCTECGFLLTEGLLTTTRSEETFSQAVRYSETTAEVKKPCRNQIQGQKRVHDLCRILRVRPVVEDTAIELYLRAYEHQSFLHVTLEKKEALVGCCVHISCRQHNWPLTMSTICSLLHVEPTLFSTVYQHMVKELTLDIPTLSLLDLVKTHCDGLNLFQNSASVPSMFLENKDKVVDRALQLVELASETWLVTGRHPVPIITAAAYLAWQSLLPVHRLKCSLGKFCRLAGIRQPPPASLRVKEIVDILLRLASQLAWLASQRLDAKTVVKYTDDVLRHRALLLRQTLSLTWTENPGGPTDPGEGTGTETGGETEGGGEWTRDGEGGETGPSPQDQLSPAGTVGPGHKRAAPIFLPPCLTQRKKRKSCPEAEGSQGTEPTTGEEEISDSEIEQYLRTPEEVAAFRAARAIL
ncbi:transcription factor IIIB 50 kDa subunit-like [Carcharodon carcharias]|uniref:transcription factor IIIB 50 kDa subunit-like n=1 Tax=Carcharodon carcharias TaxID=13397 RepID=UPI001B7F6703|nr:transcription factor IIIB 50 kDa subunit-like [Carcharodon carcharias]XP_041065151.1 transcription factor IIIB 50 kDa subunit-like [Carcharodon carcharias]